MNEELQNKWVGGVCLHNESVLLIHRINKERLFNQEYFVFPGKEVEGDESIEQALAETFQTIGLTIHRKELFYSKEDVGELEYYYDCEYAFGDILNHSTQQTGGQEQFFTPMWVNLNELDELIVYPESVKEKLIEATLTEKALES